MTLKPPYRGRTLKDVPPTETLTRPRVVMVQPLAAADLCRASHGRGGGRALPSVASCCGARGSLGRRRVLPSKTPN